MHDYSEWSKKATNNQLLQELINLEFVKLENIPIDKRIIELKNELFSRGKEDYIDISKEEAITRFSERFFLIDL